MSRKMSSIYSADDVYLTKKNIAVRKVLSGRNGRIVKDETRYYPRTQNNIRIATSVWGPLRMGRK